MIIIFTFPLNSVLGHGSLGFALPLPLLGLQLIIKGPGELEFCPPFLNASYLVRRSGVHLNILLNLKDVLEAGIEVEQEQDQLVQQFERVVWRDQDRLVSILL